MDLKEIRLLTGGINSDDADFAIGKDQLYNAVNVKTSTSLTQNTNAVQFIDGNVNIPSFINGTKYSAYQPNVPQAPYATGLQPRYIEKGKCTFGDDTYFFLQDYNESPEQFAITGATNATPIVITIPSTSTFNDGDIVNISFVTGNTATPYVKVLSPTTLGLYSNHSLTTPISGSGAYTGGGIIYNVSQLYPFTYGYPNGATTQDAVIPRESKIVKYNKATDTTTLILSEYWFDWGDGLSLTDQWGAIDFIDCGVSDNKLFWVDSIPRYIDLSINYLTEYTTGELPNYANTYHNTLTLIPASILSLITEPSVVPLSFNERTDTAVITSQTQFKALQFCVRFTNQSGFYSVLSPYSVTKTPVRQDEIVTNGSQYRNVVDIKLRYAQKIPLNWQTVEYIVRDLETNAFYVIKAWDRDNPIDKQEVDDHNSLTTRLTLTGYYGTNLYAVDSGSIAKQFDNVPLSANSLALVSNRLLLGGIVEGYDTTTAGTGFLSTALTPYTITDASTLNAPIIYMVMAYTGATPCYAFIVRYSGNNYILPKQYNSCGDIIYDATAKTLKRTDGGRFFDMPAITNLLGLIKTNETGDFTNGGSPTLYPSNVGSPQKEYLCNILTEALANGTVIDSGSYDLYLCKYSNYLFSSNLIAIKDSTDEIDNICFEPNSNYKLGVQFYDDALRKSGVRYVDTFSIQAYGLSSNNTLYDTLGVTMANVSPSPVPSWAKHYSVTLSKQQKSNKTISFIPDIIKIAVKNSANNVIYAGVEQISIAVESGYSIWGLAISLSELAQYGYGYEYAKGDTVELTGTLSSNDYFEEGVVLAVQDGYLIASLNSSSTLYAGISISTSSMVMNLDNTNKCVYLSNVSANSVYATRTLVTINMGQPDIQEYEVGNAFGECANSQFGNFYESSSLSFNFAGDHYTQVRNAATGGYIVPSYTSNEQFAKFPVTNLGRICPEDRIGQKSLLTSIRWSNTFIPSAQTNGYSSFDALDIEVLDLSAEELVRLIPTTKDATGGSQMVVLGKGNSFTTLVGKAQLFGADQQTAAITSTNNVLGEINPIRGGWCCNSPKSAVQFQGKVFWADGRNISIIQFDSNGAEPISKKFKGTRLFKQLFSQYQTLNNYYIRHILGAVNPYTSEYMVSFLKADPAVTQTLLPTTSIVNPFDCYNPNQICYIYNWDKNSWEGNWEQSNEMINVGFDVLGFGFEPVSGYPNQWVNVLYKEFSGTAGVYNGFAHDAIIAMPFNQSYPQIKTAISLEVDATRPPDETYVQAKGMGTTTTNVGVAVVADWQYREGNWVSDVKFNRLTNNATTTQEYNNNGFSGDKLKGKTHQVVMIWYGSGQEFYCNSVAMNFEASLGDNKQQK